MNPLTAEGFLNFLFYLSYIYIVPETESFNPCKKGEDCKKKKVRRGPEKGVGVQINNLKLIIDIVSRANKPYLNLIIYMSNSDHPVLNFFRGRYSITAKVRYRLVNFINLKYANIICHNEKSAN